jgi:hypothetical protein
MAPVQQIYARLFTHTDLATSLFLKQEPFELQSHMVTLEEDLDGPRGS